APPGLGVVLCWQPQPLSMFSGNVALVNSLSARQLFTDSPNSPPSSVTSPAKLPAAAPLPENELPAILLATSWNGIGGDPFGNSNPSTPLLALPVIALPSSRSAYVATNSTPTPHGASAGVEFAGVGRWLFSAFTLLRTLVRRLIRV